MQLPQPIVFVPLRMINTEHLFSQFFREKMAAEALLQQNHWMTCRLISARCQCQLQMEESPVETAMDLICRLRWVRNTQQYIVQKISLALAELNGGICPNALLQRSCQDIQELNQGLQGIQSQILEECYTFLVHTQLHYLKIIHQQ